jgi:hypothetical protein
MNAVLLARLYLSTKMFVAYPIDTTMQRLIVNVVLMLVLLLSSTGKVDPYLIGNFTQRNNAHIVQKVFDTFVAKEEGE